jgi:hypothetical protein
MAGYPHKRGCPYPEFRVGESIEAAWMAARERQAGGKLVVGDRVKYRDVNLWTPRYYGRVESVGRTSRGGDCIIRWGNGLVTEECLANLVRNEAG